MTADARADMSHDLLRQERQPLDVFFSPTVDRRIYESLRRISLSGANHWIELAGAEKVLVKMSKIERERLQALLVNVAYANKNNLKVGSDLPINGTTYHVAGLVNPTLSGNTADVYFPLATMQDLASKQGRVNEVLVRVKNSASVDKVAKEISQALPGAHHWHEDQRCCGRDEHRAGDGIDHARAQCVEQSADRGTRDRGRLLGRG